MKDMKQNNSAWKSRLKTKADHMGAVFSQDSQAFEFLAKA
jgi:hypothetical protein